MLARTPPHSLEVERAVLGCLLMEGTRVMDLLAGTALVEGDFFTERHRAIYRAIVTLHVASEPIDLMTTHEALKRCGDLEVAGGAAALAQLVEDAVFVSQADAYARRMVDYGTLREVIQAASGAISRAFDAHQSADEVIGELDQVLDKLRRRSRGEDYDPAVAWSRVVLGWKRGVIRLGLEPLDAVTGGHMRGDLVVVAGRSSHGKTALMACDRPLALAQAGVRVDVIALEEPEDAITRRWVGNLADVPLYALRRGDLSPAEFLRAESAVAAIQKFPLRVVGVQTLRSAEERVVIAEVALSKADVVVIDHADKVEYRRAGREDLRTYAIGRFLNRLHLLAQRDRKLVIVNAQLDRAVERTRRRPTVGDISGSQQFERVARQILLLWWPWKVTPDKHPAGEFEVYVAKNSEGGTGKVELGYRAATGRFGPRGAVPVDPDVRAEEAPF